MMQKFNSKPYIYRSYIRTRNGNIIYASQYGKKAFKIYI